jgi:non-reducing end alpha-L-arabinofuranosidase
MRTTYFRKQILLVAIGGMSSWGCTVMSSDSDGGGALSCQPSNACMGMTPTPPAAPPAGTALGPCDIYAADGGPCVAAHSTARALYATFTGALYQVRKADGTTHDVLPVAAGGLANAADQDAFCGVDGCTISIIYDQSGWANHLTKAPAGMAKTTPANEANAKSVPLMLGTEKVYGVHIVPGIGYRNNGACGTAACEEAETEYMVVAGDFFNSNCCFDYGNMERNSRDNGEGTMEAVYFGKCTIWNKGDGQGPWVMGDLENGLWAGDSSPYMDNPTIPAWKYVTGLVKGESANSTFPSGHWAIKEGDAATPTITKVFDGKRPSARYSPMRKEGAIGLGTGGDNSNAAQGNWFEGVMTHHYSSDQADSDVQASIASVYGQAQ